MARRTESWAATHDANSDSVVFRDSPKGVKHIMLWSGSLAVVRGKIRTSYHSGACMCKIEQRLRASACNIEEPPTMKPVWG